MDNLDVNTSSVTGNPVLVCVASNPGGLLHSITPITGPDGDVEGFWLGEAPSFAGADSDMYFVDDLDPTTPIVPLVDTPGWLNNGGVTGGRFHYADDAQPVNRAIKEVDGAWILGDDEALGGTADLFGAVIDASTNSPASTSVFIANALAPITVPVPGFFGEFGLDFPSLILLATMTHADDSQGASLSFPVPSDPNLRGTIFMQGVSLHASTATLTFTNTARMKLR